MKPNIVIASFLAIYLIVVQTGLAHGRSLPQVNVDQDIVYSSSFRGNSDKSKLDIYYPGTRKGNRLAVFVHGGSWVSGDKSHIQKSRAMIPWFLRRGYVVAAPNFRLASPPRYARGVGYVKQAQDIASSIAWLKKHGSEYGVTKPGIVLVGYSSGAHMVALLSSDERYLKQVGLSLKDIAASISLDVHAYDVPYALSLMQNSSLRRNMPLIKAVFGSSLKEQLAGSPVQYIKSAQVPPSLLISADVPNQGSKGEIAMKTTKRYANLLNSTGHTAYAVHFANETHSSLVMDFGQPDDGPTKVVSEFLKRSKL